MRISESACLFTFINICKLVSRFIFNFRPICLLYVKNNNKYSHEQIYKYEIRNQHTCLPIITFGN